MSEILVLINTALAGIMAWFVTVLAGVETAIETSVLLQILLGVMAVFLGFTIVKKVIGVIRGFTRVK